MAQMDPMVEIISQGGLELQCGVVKRAQTEVAGQTDEFVKRLVGVFPFLDGRSDFVDETSVGSRKALQVRPQSL